MTESIKPNKRRKPGTKTKRYSKEKREEVETLVGYGFPVKAIAQMVSVPTRSLERHFKHELAAGHMKANAKIIDTLFARAMAGDTGCLIFWCKTQMGWREGRRNEPTAPPDPKTVEAWALGVMKDAATSGSWQAAAWLLERKWPELYAARDPFDLPPNVSPAQALVAHEKAITVLRQRIVDDAERVPTKESKPDDK